MDFFSEVGGAQSNSTRDAVDPFSEAIAARFGSGSMLTARLLPSEQLGSPSTPYAGPTFPTAALPQPMSTMSIGNVSNLHFTPVPPSLLAAALGEPGLLVVDIRPNAAYASARLPTALSLSVPSTLLKRPLFSLERLAAMLPSLAARSRFLGWRTATRILVYDADSSQLNESSNIHGLLRKFKADGFMGDLAWAQGGYQAVWRERKDLVDTSSLSPETDDEDEDVVMSPSAQTLRVNHLPMSAFSLASTTASKSTNKGMSTPAPPTRGNTTPAAVAPARPAFNPFFDTIRQNTELSHGITERISLRLPKRVRKRIGELPFTWLQDIAKRASIHQYADPNESSESEGDEDQVDIADIEEGTEALAMQFYRIELAEQRRLMGVMEHHSKESSSALHPQTHVSSTFPFSITAGVEKGAKNRYRHIWPFEHARVRLHTRQTSSGTAEEVNDRHDDYINASYVQPLGTTKCFIATQGPLPATFNDFWTLCWEQNIHVIVMLTREVEGAQIKCGTYWTDSSYGPIRLKLLETTGAEDEPEAERGFFATRDQAPKSPRTSTIRRTFQLSNTAFPKAPPRTLVHFQYLEWPDMNVPDDPRGLLTLIQEVNATVKVLGSPKPAQSPPSLNNAVNSETGIANHGFGESPPVLLHCSAGVGRTGGYIAVDSILDGVRREMRAKLAGQAKEKLSVSAMDVDVPEPTFKAVSADMVNSGLVVPLSVTAHGASDEIVHVPVAGWSEVGGSIGGTGSRGGTVTGAGGSTSASVAGDPSRMPYAFGGGMAVDQWSPRILPSEALRYENSRSSKVLLQGMQVVSSPMPASPWVKDRTRSTTTQWAQTVMDETSEEETSEVSNARITSPSGDFFTMQPPKRAGLPPKAGSGSRASSSSVTSGPPSSVASGEFAFELPQEGSSLGTSAASSVLHHDTPVKSRTDPSNITSMPVADSRVRTFSVPVSTSKPAPGASRFAGPSLSRPQLPLSLFTARPGGSPAPPPATVGTALPDPGPQTMAPPRRLNDSLRSTRVDYKEPRTQHGDLSLTLLNSLDEPVCEVLQDMREQRMSLCQSLRQYVFVHAAIIEGALQVVDEEREYAGLRASPMMPTLYKPIVRVPRKSFHSDSQSSIPEGTRVTQTYPPRPTLPKLHHSGSSASTVSSSPSKGKRMASPTELQKEDTKGAAMLSKRPSIKRKVPTGSQTAGFMTPISTAATAGSSGPPSRSFTPQPPPQ